MADIIIHGPPQSSYVRSTRMACVEKGIEHELRPVELGSESHLALHPFGKVPVLDHGDLRFYESSAIVRYLDAAFDSGNRLVPEDPAEAATAEQWISTLNCYFYDDMVKQYSLVGYIFAKDGPNREVIDAQLPKLDRDFGLLDAALSASTWLSGSSYGIADLLMGPAVGTAAMFPEAKERIDNSPKLAAWLAAVADRPSAQYLAPPPRG